MVGAQLDSKRGDGRLSAGRALLASATTAGKNGERSPVLERGVPRCTRDVTSEGAKPLDLRRRRLRPHRPLAGAGRDRRRDLAGDDLAVEQREDDRLGERLRRGGRAGRCEHSCARAADADDRAVRGVLERLNVHRGRGRPLEISERDAVLAGDRDAQQERGRARGGAARRRSGGRERCRSDEGCDDRDGEADHGESG